MAALSPAELEARVRACLHQVKDPCSVATGHPLHLEEMGLVKTVEVDAAAGRVSVDLRLTSPTCVMVGFFVTEIERLVKEALPEITEVAVSFDHGFDWTPEMMSDEVRRARAERFAAGADRLRRPLAQTVP
jgi:metal-sulfur cluster biosynthetic enzyme